MNRYAHDVAIIRYETRFVEAENPEQAKEKLAWGSEVTSVSYGTQREEIITPLFQHKGDIPK